MHGHFSKHVYKQFDIFLCQYDCNCLIFHGQISINVQDFPIELGLAENIDILEVLNKEASDFKLSLSNDSILLTLLTIQQFRFA